MELFHEVYNCYYTIVGSILQQAAESPLTPSRIYEIISGYGFEESRSAIIPKLLNGEWNLLEKSEQGYQSKLKTSIKLPLTNLQKSWLKALLFDPRICLFLEEEERASFAEYLKEVNPLYHRKDFSFFDQYTDGDDFTNPQYQDSFRKVLTAIKQKRILHLTYSSKNGRTLHRSYLPCRLEYSMKEDKFRTFALLWKDGQIAQMSILNISRIVNADFAEVYEKPVSIDSYLNALKCIEPVVLEITTSRNALERTMLHFANYDKKTEYNEQTGTYLCSIYYNKVDETELLIRILSFGPVVKVLQPKHFIELMKIRIKKQQKLFEFPHSPN